MLEEASYYLSDYVRYEAILIEISHHISIDDNQLNIYSEELSDFIVEVGASVESLSKYLHSYAADRFINQQIPTIKRPDKFPEFKSNESFETVALFALESLWQLSHKEIIINSPSIHLTEETRILIPFGFLDQKSTDNCTNCFKSYQFIKHNRMESLREKARERLIAQNLYQIYSNIHTITVGLFYSLNKSHTMIHDLEKNISNIEQYIDINKNNIENENKANERRIRLKIEAKLSDSEKDLNDLRSSISILTNAVENTHGLIEKTSLIRESFLHDIITIDNKPKFKPTPKPTVRPTVKLAFDMLGAFFILCTYVRYLEPKHFNQAPNIQHVVFYNDMDSVKYSKLFETKIIDIRFTSFVSNTLSIGYANDIRVLSENEISKSLFLVYDSDKFIEPMYRLEQSLLNKTMDIIDRYRQINKNFAQCIEEQQFKLADIENEVRFEQILNDLINSFCNKYPSEKESSYILQLKEILLDESKLYQKYNTDLRDSPQKRLNGTATSIILNTFTTERIYDFFQVYKRFQCNNKHLARHM